jgi:hypothetical protein
MIPRASPLCRRRKPAVKTFVDNNAKLRPQAVALALRPSTCNKQRAAPRAAACSSEPSWFHGHRPGHHTEILCRRRKPTAEVFVDNTVKLRPQASAFAPRPFTCNAQRAAPRATACTLRSSTCVAPRASAWAPLPSTSTHSERRCEQRPGHHDQVPRGT